MHAGVTASQMSALSCQIMINLSVWSCCISHKPNDILGTVMPHYVRHCHVQDSSCCCKVLPSCTDQVTGMLACWLQGYQPVWCIVQHRWQQPSRKVPWWVLAWSQADLANTMLDSDIYWRLDVCQSDERISIMYHDGWLVVSGTQTAVHCLEDKHD